VVGGDGRPRVLDFGVARLALADGRDSAARAPLAGTLPYMSPEALSGSPGEAETRSDVYALGVMSREVLTGSLPPRGDVGRLGRDVALVVAKAMEREASRRYASAAALADDLRRLVRREPVAARPASAAYVLRKLARRHAGAFAIVSASLALGLGAASWSFRDAVRARDLAERRRAEAETARDAARAEARRAEAVRDFVLETLRQADPTSGRKLPSAADLLRLAASALGPGFPGEPALEADLRYRLALTLRNNGLLSEAADEVSRALALRRRGLGPDNPDTRQAALLAAVIDSDRGQSGLAERALREIAAHAIEGETPPEHLAVDAEINHALELRKLGRLDESERALSDALGRYLRAGGPRDPHLVWIRLEIASVLAVLERDAEAEFHLRAALELAEESLEPRHHWILRARNLLAMRLETSGRFGDAIDLHERTLADRRAVLGDEHPDTLESLHNLASAYGAAGRREESIDLLRKTVEIRSRTLGAGHPRTLVSQNNLAQELRRGGRTDEAEAILARIVETSATAYAPGDWRGAVLLSNFGSLLLERGRLDEAERRLEDALAVLERSLGADHARTRETRAHLADLDRSRRAAERRD